MATIKSAIQLYDNVSPALRAMNKAMNIAVGSFEALNTASSNAIDVNAIAQMRSELARAEVAFDQVGQEIQDAAQAQQNFNNDVRNGGNAADGLKNKILSMAGALGAAFSAKKIIELADTMTTTRARLDLMNDGLQTTEELQNKIMASANRSRAAYQTTADAVSKMGMQAGDAFKSNDELIAFSELLNKSFVNAGTSAAGIDSVMLQLTQSMASGRLQGEELNAVLDNAGTLVQYIADYLDVPKGKIKELASEGVITSEVIKNAMFAASDDINAQFAQMPMTFVQVWTLLQNTLLQAFEPLIQAIGAGAQWIYDNWSTLEPIFWGLGAAVVAYAAGLGIMKIATLLQTIAQNGLNATLLACPLVWIALAIGAVIAIIYKWVQSVGGLKVAWLICTNAIMTAWDWVKIGFFTGVYWVIGLWEKMQLAFKTVATNIANFMGDMKANVLMILQNMVNGAIDIINGFINILNKIPGVSIDMIAQVTFGTTAQLENEAAKTARNNDLAAYRSELDANAASRDAALNQMKNDARSATADREAEIAAARVNVAVEDNTSAFMLGNTLDNIAAGVNDVAGNTASIHDVLDESEEDLKYMRDMAEREAINRYAGSEIVIDMSGANYNISYDMDIDGVVEALEEKVYEAMVISAEGVHE